MNFKRYKQLVEMMFIPDEQGNILERYDKINVASLHPLVLAYVGDAWFHLFVRMRLLSFEQSKVHILHQFSAQIVSAVWQAKAYTCIESSLTEQEKAIYRRGRNANSHAPRSSSVAEYHMSTGFEALLGTLYLNDEKERLQYISEAAFQVIAAEMMCDIQGRKGDQHAKG